VGVNKCNITKFTNIELNKINFGSKYNLSSKEILENYIQFLNCPTVNINICYPDNCNNSTIDFTCTIAISAISQIIDNRTITFFLDLGSLTNYVNPLQYLWTYDNTVFDITGGLNQSTLVLTLKSGKIFDNLVSQVTLKVTDANGCSITKSCFLVSEAMQCSTYILCSNPRNLNIVNRMVYCVSPSGLIVNKI
jgi:hypothetical protein